MADARHADLQFERDFAAYHQARHGIAVTKGTHALEVVLRQGCRGMR